MPVVDGESAFDAFPVVELRAVIDLDTSGGSVDEGREDLRELAAQVWRNCWYGDRDIRLGGFALTPQSNPADEIAAQEQRATGGDLDELTRRAEREWVPLAQLGSEDPIEAATVARFMARRADVAAGDFGRVISVAEFME